MNRSWFLRILFVMEIIEHPCFISRILPRKSHSLLFRNIDMNLQCAAEKTIRDLQTS